MWNGSEYYKVPSLISLDPLVNRQLSPRKPVESKASAVLLPSDRVADLVENDDWDLESVMSIDNIGLVGAKPKPQERQKHF